MHLIECVVLGLFSLRRHPLRTSLTVLGIVVGVGSVVSMVSVGDGSRALVLGEIERTGGLNIIEIVRDDWDKQSGTFTRAAGQTLRTRRWKRNRAEHLETEDVYEILEKARGVVHAIGEDDQGGWSVNYKGISKESRIIASTAGYDRSHHWYPVMGRFFTEKEVDDASTVAVIGYKIYQDVFKGEDPIGKELKATRATSWGPRYDVRLTVIGVMQEKQQMGTYGGPDALQAVMPLSTFQAMFGRRYLSNLVIKPTTPELMDSAKRRLYEVLGGKYRFNPDDERVLAIWDTAESQKITANILLGIEIFLGIIGALTLIIGGVGVANIMYAVVKERTREIGVQMALGARRSYVMGPFVVESLLLTCIGGVLGIVRGW